MGGAWLRNRLIFHNAVAVCSQVGVLHRVPTREELHQPLEQRRLPVCRRRLHHGPDGEQGGGSHWGHWRLAVSPPASHHSGSTRCSESWFNGGSWPCWAGSRTIRSSGAACWGRCVTPLVPPACPCASTPPGCPNCRRPCFLYQPQLQHCLETPAPNPRPKSFQASHLIVLELNFDICASLNSKIFCISTINTAISSKMCHPQCIWKGGRRQHWSFGLLCTSFIAALL